MVEVTSFILTAVNTFVEIFLLSPMQAFNGKIVNFVQSQKSSKEMFTQWPSK